MRSIDLVLLVVKSLLQPNLPHSPELKWKQTGFFFFYLLYHLPSNLSTTLEYNAFTDTHT